MPPGRTVDEPCGGWCEVTLRPAGHPSLSLCRPGGGGRRTALAIRLQNPSSESPGPLAAVFRVVDRLGTQWSYARGPDYPLVEILQPGESREVLLNLADPCCWRLFEPDGNWAYHAAGPDFSIIAAIVVEVGGPYGNRRPGVGSGTLIIRSIRVGDVP
jgi:hypothetical protein